MLKATDTNGFYKEFYDLKKKQDGVLKKRFNELLEPLNLNDSKTLLVSLLKHSHLLSQRVNGLISADLNALNYMQAVNWNLSNILENTPHMIIDKHFPNATQEFHINAIKENIVEYLLFLNVLTEHIQITRFENPAYHHHLNTVLKFELETHFLPSIYIQ